MKYRLICILALAMLLISSCSVNEPVEVPTEEEVVESTESYKAAFITSTARGNEFIDLIWSGFETLESEGWEVKCIETFETAEQPEQIRALAEEGYNLIYTQGDDVMQSVLDLEDELVANYPDMHFFFLDTYTDTTMPNSTSVTIDPFESCFLAGFIAANVTETGTIGIMMPMDTPIMDRFKYGYLAGIDYADSLSGKETVTVIGYTNDWVDTVKGQEATFAMAENYPVDLIIHCAYISGYGVISACADLGIPCIGVDDWQGDIDPIVFWSAVKSMNVAVEKTAYAWMNGEDLPFKMEYGLKEGGKAYAEQDLANLSEELQESVLGLEQDIINGEVDVFSGDYEEWRETGSN